MTKKKEKSKRAKRIDKVQDSAYIKDQHGSRRDPTPLTSLFYRPGQIAFHIPSDPDKPKDSHGIMLDRAYDLWKHPDNYSDSYHDSIVEDLQEYEDPSRSRRTPTKLSKDASLDYVDVALREVRKMAKKSESGWKNKTYLKKIVELKEMREDIGNHWDDIAAVVHAEKREKDLSLSSRIVGLTAIFFGGLSLINFSNNITGNVVGGWESNTIFGFIFIIITIVLAGLYFWKRKK